MTATKRDMRHRQTPPSERGSLWTLREHAYAEQDVSIASWSLDNARDPFTRYLWQRLYDSRLEHLAEVEDEAYRIIERLEATAPAHVSDAAERFFLKHESWLSIAGRYGMTTSKLYGIVTSAADRLDRMG